jgi:hypothetical protein
MKKMKCCEYGSRLKEAVMISGSDLDPVASKSFRRVQRENDGDVSGGTMESSTE